MTNAAAKPAPRLTVDEFFALDRGGHQGRIELLDGTVRAQIPASSAHGMIQINVGSLIRAHLEAKRSPCQVGAEVAVTPRTGARTNVRVPDITVTRAPHTPGEKSFPDPVLIVEILLPTNEKEAWESLRACATLPGLVEILVLYPEAARAEVFRKDARKDAAGAWPQDPEVTEADGTVQLASIEARLPTAEVYAGVNFHSPA